MRRVYHNTKLGGALRRDPRRAESALYAGDHVAVGVVTVAKLGGVKDPRRADKLGRVRKPPGKVTSLYNLNRFAFPVKSTAYIVYYGLALFFINTFMTIRGFPIAN
jgi:hypothetical protein